MFEKLRPRKSAFHMSRKKWLTMKMDLFDEYEPPKPFPSDKHLKISKNPPTLAYIFLGTKGTGKNVIK